MSGPYQRRDLSNCGCGMLRVVNNCGVLSVKALSYAEYVLCCTEVIVWWVSVSFSLEE